MTKSVATCPGCGEVGSPYTSVGLEHGKRLRYFVCAKCGKRYKTVEDQSGKSVLGSCLFNVGVTCGSKTGCAKCGWNPKEHAKIVDILKEQGIGHVKTYIAKRDEKEIDDVWTY